LPIIANICQKSIIILTANRYVDFLLFCGRWIAESEQTEWVVILYSVASQHTDAKSLVFSKNHLFH